MLFNSYVFMFLFLPLTLATFYFIAGFSQRMAISCLLFASMFFYGWWNPIYVSLLAGSIIFNYFVGMALIKDQRPLRHKKNILAFGIAANIALLCYYKYANFFLSTIDPGLADSLGATDIILPMGISFFTFTQIAFLVDSYRGEVREHNFINYGLFVTYFPHLIAGPVLHHKEIIPQFSNASTFKPNYGNFSVGLTIFSIGLFKKVMLADGIAPFVAPVFDAAADGTSISFSDAWIGALAFHFQIYFDFSGYSDMAIGLSWMFGVSLPINFYSPYKATNIIEFWRCWHMTLSRFLRDYLYIPLGGNRKGISRRYANLLVTMLLGGLWHGAGWTYLIWGGVHGVCLAANHAWHSVRKRLGQSVSTPSLGGRWLSRILTTLIVVVAWVFFRATDLSAANSILTSMAGLNGLDIAAQRSVETLNQMMIFTTLAEKDIVSLDLGIIYGIFAVMFLLVWGLPNTAELTSKVTAKTQSQPRIVQPPRLAIMTRGYYTTAILTGIFLVVSILGLTSETPSEFLYFQF